LHFIVVEVPLVAVSQEAEVVLGLLEQALDHHTALDVLLVVVGLEPHVASLRTGEDLAGHGLRALGPEVHLDVVASGVALEPDLAIRRRRGETDVPPSELHLRDLFGRRRPQDFDDPGGQLRLQLIVFGVDPGDHHLGQLLAVDALGEGTKRGETGLQGDDDLEVVVVGSEMCAELRSLHGCPSFRFRDTSCSGIATGQGLYGYLWIATKFLSCKSFLLKRTLSKLKILAL